MTINNLDKMFAPKTVALCGFSPKEGSVGNKIWRNLKDTDFGGEIWPVNPKYDEIDGMKCYRSVADLPSAPDLAVFAIPPKAIPDTLDQLVEKGNRAGVMITAGVRQDEEVFSRIMKNVNEHGYRIVGPNCMGIMVNEIGLNATFAHMPPTEKGDLAFISQSGAIMTSVLDWAKGRDIGFSYMISVGDMVDVDVADILDYMASDPGTSAILMYLEQITNPRSFMSAARAAAKIKPVVVIKSGRHEAGAAAAASHTGALAGADNVYSAAFERAGILRVTELSELFDAAEILSRQKPITGDRLAIITNGGGVGVLAVDCLMDEKGTLAPMSQELMDKLNSFLPDSWSKANPIDIIGDAPPEYYYKSTIAALEDDDVDAILVMNCPTAMASSYEAAEATIQAVKEYNEKPDSRPKAVVTNWVGAATADAARELLSSSGIPAYGAPSYAVHAYSYLTGYVKAQDNLMKCPPFLPDEVKVDAAKAREIINPVIEEGRDMLTESEAKKLLALYGIRIVPTHEASSPEDAYNAAVRMKEEGFDKFVIKILSKDISHKSDSGGVVLNIKTPEDVRKEAEEMLVRVAGNCPNARLDGFTVQPMVDASEAHELIVGVSEDITFGPIILFGAGGTSVEVVKDRAVSLPPLDMNLAKEQIAKTNIYKLLKGYRDRPAAAIDEIALTLVKISNMIAELPEIYELDINPLLADDKGVIALDARVVVKKAESESNGLNPRFSIRPYPKYLEEVTTLQDASSVLLRPIRPEDERLYETFTGKIEAEDRRMSIFRPSRDIPREFIARLTQIDYSRAMTFVAIDEKSGELIGISRFTADPNLESAEYGVIVREDMKGKGLGWILMQKLIAYAKSEGISSLWGEVPEVSEEMIQMCGELGFDISRCENNADTMKAVLNIAK